MGNGKDARKSRADRCGICLEYPGCFYSTYFQKIAHNGVHMAHNQLAMQGNLLEKILCLVALQVADEMPLDIRRHLCICESCHRLFD